VTTPTIFQQTGLSINTFVPVIALTESTENSAVYTPEGAAFERLTDVISAYSHSRTAVGGFWDATITMQGPQLTLERWLQQGLGKHIVVVDYAGETVWEGYVDKVTVNAAGLSIVVGGLRDMANRASVIYSTTDMTTDPPQVGIRDETAISEDAASQRRYGILTKVLSTGGVTAAAALQIRDMYLAERAAPAMTKQLDLTGTSGQQSITLDCLGYHAWLSYIYRSTTTGLQNASAKLAAVLDADINALFASTNADITTNAEQVKAFETRNETAWAHVKDIVGRGDTSDDRQLFDVGPGRFVKYGPAPTEVEYHQYITSESQQVTTVNGAPVRPWQVKPGKWLRFPDLLAGHTFPTDLRDNPRSMFIERAIYTAPYGLQLHGGPMDRMPQLIASLGLSGIGG
jgi:hypothetical protein